MSRGGEVPKVYSRKFPFIEKEIVQNELHGDKLLMNSLTHWLCYFSVSIPSEARYAWQDNLQITFSTSKQVWHSCGRLCSESPFYSAEQSFTNEEAQSCCCWTDQHWTCSLLLAHTCTPRSYFGSRYISVKTFHYIWWGWSMAMLTTTWEARGLKIYSFEATCRRVPYFPIKPSRPHWPIKRLSSAAALKQSTLTLNVCTVQHWKTPFTIQIFTRQTAGQLHCGFSTRIWR